MYYIYTLTQNDTVKYVGQTINPSKRKSSHKSTRESHEFEIIFQCEDKEIVKEKEIELILEYNTYMNGWNKPPGGEGFDEYSRRGIGGAKPGRIPWNKNKPGCFSDETIKQFSNVRRGKVWGPTKLTVVDVIKIRKLYDSGIHLDGVGEKMKNGRYMSYSQAFSTKYANIYKVSTQNIRYIVERKTWNNV